MAQRGAAAALVFLLSACGGVGEDQPDDIVFRVGATAGLSELVPGPDLRGSSAAAVDLIYDYATDHVEDMRPEGSRVLLRRRPRSPHTAKQLAESFRCSGLVSARALGPDRIEAVFKDEASARRSVNPASLAAFDIGPFRIESQEPGRARLRRRAPGGIDVIEIVEVSTADEWRKLMARELDVMSFSPSLYRDQFDGMASVRLMDIPPAISVALYFNVRDAALASADVRRRIAAAINRQAIARVASGDPSSAAAPIAGGAGEEVALPARLSLILNKDDSTLLLAGSVLRHQLDRLKIALDVQAVPVDDLVAKMHQGQHQLVMGPLPNGNRRYGRFRSPGPDDVVPLSGFADPEYDAAVAAGSFDKAQAILDRELPATVLYEWRAFAAVDSRFCGKVTPSAISWRWMADLHPCEDGEGEGRATP